MPFMSEQKLPVPKPPLPPAAGRPRCTCVLFMLLVTVTIIHAGEPALSESMTLNQANSGQLSDLSLSNFFSDGWREPWSKRPRGDGTPDMSLLRVQTNFLVQLFRLDTYLETNVHSAKTQSIAYMNATVEYAVSRRLMFAVFSNLEQHESRVASDEHGFGGGFFSRVQLIDRAASSGALTVKVAAPDTRLDQHQTTLSYTLSGWQDLKPFGLEKTGLYFHAQHEILVGPHRAGAKQNDVTYDISLAKTWTSPDSAIENLTTFVEAFGRTDLDGAKAGGTAVAITPGFRFNFRQKQILMFGVDLPVSNPRHYNNIFRLTYIANF
jgi:hypothetical protein